MSWLRAFVESERFFSSCAVCAAKGAAPRECALNLWACEDGVECCSCCAGQHAGTILQVRTRRGAAAQAPPEPPQALEQRSPPGRPRAR